MPLSKKRSRTVNKGGAAAGCVLLGCAPHNRGLRLRMSQAQPSGHDGPITGGFVILDVGDNKHSEALLPLLGRATDAREVLGAIRRHHAGCVSVANSNILVPEQSA